MEQQYCGPWRAPALVVATCCAFAISALVDARQEPPAPAKKPRVYAGGPPPSATSPVERLGEFRLRIGRVLVDMEAKEVSVPGVVNDVTLFEFLASTRGGYKSYESLIEADTPAIDLNLGLILIGMDRERAKPPRAHFDPAIPKGDPVEIWVAWTAGGQARKVRGEELIFDEGSGQTLSAGRWVYTGSQFVRGGRGLLADVDGVLIGFVHSPSPLIERAEPIPGPFTAITLNRRLELTPGTAVTLSLKAAVPARR